MLYQLFYKVTGGQHLFNVFRYISFRSMLVLATAFIVTLIIGKWLIRALSEKKIGQEIRNDGPESHFSKKGTPTMGGVMILVALAVSVLLWTDLQSRLIWLALATALGFGLVGFIDDFMKFRQKNSKGLSAKAKLAGQWGIGLAISGALYVGGFDTQLFVPFAKGLSVDLGWFFIPFAALVMVSASNAVNLTDGLDGLAIGPTLVVSATFAIFSYCSGHAGFAAYLGIPHIPAAGELTIICAAMIGASLGFLWYNSYPAQVFMGDVGSLSIGAILGFIAVATKNELQLVLCGLIFVVETLSVMVQVISFKYFGKRVFRMAPIHHHFELKGWAEPKIIVRFWIISILSALLSLSTLKLR